MWPQQQYFKKLPVAICKPRNVVSGCHTKDRCDMSGFAVVLLGFMIGMVDTVAANEITEQTVPERPYFERKTMDYECKKID